VELSTTDVDPDWFVDNTGEAVEPSRPLSQTWVTPYVFVGPDARTGELTVPTVTDSLTEPDEVVELHFIPYVEAPVPSDVLTGVVTGG
jgi:hypothetical protein